MISCAWKVSSAVRSHLYYCVSFSGALHVACALNAKNKVLVREAGGIPVVIACMHAHMSSAKLLQRACGVLWNVTCQ